MPRTRLAQIIDAIETRGQVSAYLDRQTGKVFIITEDDEAAAMSGDDDAADWQEGSIELARRVAGDAGDRFLAIPDEFEIDEWRMMAEFASAE